MAPHQLPSQLVVFPLDPLGLACCVLFVCGVPLQVNLNDSCRGPTVNMPFEVDSPAFEVAIVNAMDHIGWVVPLVLKSRLRVCA